MSDADNDLIPPIFFVPDETPVMARLVHPDFERPEALPDFCKAVTIVDIVFCLIRGAMALIAMLAYSDVKRGDNQALLATAPFEIATGLGVATLGLAAALCMLTGNRYAVFIAWLAMLSTAASIAVGIWQSSMVFGQLQTNDPMRKGFIVGAVGAIVLRMVFLVVYGCAVNRYESWYKDRDWAWRRVQNRATRR